MEFFNLPQISRTLGIWGRLEGVGFDLALSIVDEIAVSPKDKGGSSQYRMYSVVDVCQPLSKLTTTRQAKIHSRPHKIGHTSPQFLNFPIHRRNMRNLGDNFVSLSMQIKPSE